MHLSVFSHVCVLNCVRLFATTWGVAQQAPCSWNFLGKNTGVGSHFLLQGSNPYLLHTVVCQIVKKVNLFMSCWEMEDATAGQKRPKI